LTKQLNKRGIGCLHVVEPRVKRQGNDREVHDPVAACHLRPKFTGMLIAAGSFTEETADAIIAAGHADIVAFGRHFIANPDLSKRLRLNLPLNRYDRSTFYGGDACGYTDFPFHDETQAA